MTNQPSVSSRSYESALTTNRVLRNTYFLLSLTLVFSAFTAYFAMSIHAKPSFIILLVGMFGLQFLTMKLRNSAWGVLAIFAFTGFMGFMLGPILDFYMKTYTNGGQLVMTALGATGMIFIGLSAYALTTRKDFSYLGGFIAVAIMVAFIGGIGAALFNIPMLQLLISGAFAILASAYILYTTSRIINGGERNYIMATISLYVAIFNLFVSLLQLLGAFSGNRN